MDDNIFKMKYSSGLKPAVSKRRIRLYTIPCPIWQCSGRMFQVERDEPKRLSKQDKKSGGWIGDWQTPDFVCNNCGGIYGFKRFSIKALYKLLNPIPRKAKALRILRVKL